MNADPTRFKPCQCSGKHNLQAQATGLLLSSLCSSLLLAWLRAALGVELGVCRTPEHDLMGQP